MPTTTQIDRIILTMPAYNEAEVIGELLEQGAAALGEIGLPWNILVVDDGSTDDTAAIVRAASEKEPNVRLVQHEVNQGLGPAIRTAMTTAVEISDAPGTLVVSMDADLTHPPALIPSMIAAAEQGAEMVVASRFQPGSEVVGLSAFRHLMSWGARQVFRVFLRIPGVKDYTCGFRAIRADWIRRALTEYGAEGLITRAGFACTDEILIKMALLGITIREVPFVLRYDLKQGSSKIKLGITITETLKLVAWANKELRRVGRR